MAIDNPDVKVVTASYKGQPFFIGVGISRQREAKGSGAVGFTEGVKGEYQSQKELEWRLLYNPNALPSGFVPMEKIKDLMAGTVAVTSGATAVYAPITRYEETPGEELHKFNNDLRFYKTRKRKEEFIQFILESDFYKEEKEKG